jgi:N-acetylglucosaminyldiphosphoundecaprenol N-acetyl-beta-D-mannosaminyltransferase
MIQRNWRSIIILITLATDISAVVFCSVAAYLIRMLIADMQSYSFLVFRKAVVLSGLSVPDGMPLVWLLKLKGHKNQERIYGPDLMLRICEKSEKNGWKCFLYGGKEETVKLLKIELLERFPSLNIIGSYSPPFRALTDAEDEKICRMINDAKPDILWVGLGGPKQDRWMYEHRNKLAVSVIHGVGAAFDFISGKVPQAPRWIGNLGFEWLFRLCMEPGRLWKRYTITNLKFIYYLCISGLKFDRNKKS